MTFRALAFGICALGSQASVVTVTPVEKVIALLGRLQEQVAQEGKDEAAEYDKYACFCKQEVDDKLYAVEKSTEKIAELDALITSLTADITALDGKVGALSQKIDGLGQNLDASKVTRDQEHAEFLTNLADVDGAISACERAVEALKSSKEALGGKVERESLAQLQAVAHAVLGIGGGELDEVLAARQPGKANEYKYHSNDIITTIETLKNKFTDKKNELEQEEFDTNSAFEKRQLDLANEKKFAEKDKMEKEELSEQKNEENAQAQSDRDQENTEKTADENFMQVLTQDCETKATLWDQRSKSRAAELTALSEAQTALKDGAAPNYEANKKLAGIQKAKAAPVKLALRGRWVYVEDKATVQARGGKPASFLQLRGATSGAVANRAYDYLMKRAQELKSPLLSAAALKVTLSIDHFVKVRQIIKDLVDKLASEADAERTQKQMCDTEMAQAVASRDKEATDIEKFNGEITAKEAKKAELQQDIATLGQEIAANIKALMEATELRAKENEENTKTVEEAGAGKAAVETAITVLKGFYQAALIQEKKFVPTNSDREGKTVADKAPKTSFDSEYNGSQEASKGIMGLLDVILSDFDRTSTTVAAEEAAAETDFQTFKTTNEADTKSKEDAKTVKEGEIATLEDALVELQDQLNGAEKNHELALQMLAQLHSQCVAGEETYEEKVAKREQEIEALKEAHDILQNWQQ